MIAVSCWYYNNFGEMDFANEYEALGHKSFFVPNHTPYITGQDYIYFVQGFKKAEQDYESWLVRRESPIIAYA